jgi:3-deoxy-manno-octulosonate cytidylyltransferase (CMP-KDO synthetase)
VPTNSCAIIIPARLQSVRFPSKVLARIGDLTMIHHVFNRAIEADLGIPVYVTTDSREIIEYCSIYDIPTIQTGTHNTGTDRVFEAASRIAASNIINLQGDEPLMPPSAIQSLFKLIDQSSSDSNIIFNSVCPAPCEVNNDPNIVKAIITKNQRAMYYTRHSVPTHGDSSSSYVYKQMGLYAYSLKTLKYFTNLPPSPLESREKIELMRSLEYGDAVVCEISQVPSYSVDTVADLQFVSSLFCAKQLHPH